MIKLRRLAGAFLTLLGMLGLVACVAGIVGVWRVHQPVTQRADQLCDRSVQLLNVAVDTLQQVQAGLDKASSELGEFHARSREPTDSDPLKQRVRQNVMRRLAGDLLPQMASVQRNLVMVSESAIVLDALLEQMDQMPLTSLGRIDGADVRETSQNLTALAAKAEKLGQVLGPVDGACNEADAIREATQIQAGLAQVSPHVQRYAEKVTKVRDRAAALQPRLAGWIMTAAIGMTVLLAWIGAGQLALAAHGWSWLRGAGKMGS